MLIEQLIQLAELGSKRPLLFWMDEYNRIRIEILPSLKQLASRLQEGIEVKENILQLVYVLEKESPNERELAKALMYLVELMQDDLKPENQEIGQRYTKFVSEFTRLAQLTEFSKLALEKIQKRSAEERFEYNKQLFLHEGMMFCLEYYLTLYKAIQDAPDDLSKRVYFETPEVIIGIDHLSGLQTDFKQDEVLSKFIYLISDDEIRTELTIAYFDTKEVILSDCALDKKIQKFRKLILVFLDTFEKMKIEHLSSLFLSPFGKKPLITEIKLFI